MSFAGLAIGLRLITAGLDYNTGDTQHFGGIIRRIAAVHKGVLAVSRM